MTALISQAVDTIIANTIAVIEGTGSYTGVPGVYSHDEALKGTSPSALTITATGGSTTTVVDSSRTYDADRWVKTRAPSFWLLCATATNGANVDAARKISAWSQSATTFTVGTFPAAVSSGDTFYMLEGFRGSVDGSGDDAHQDRRFVVTMEPGETTGYYGAGYQSVRSELVLSLSLAVAGKHVSAAKAALTNAEILRSAVAKPAHWESTYTRAIMTDGSSIKLGEQSSDRITAEIRWPIIYRMAVAFV